jgi:hypothetical protein
MLINLPSKDTIVSTFDPLHYHKSWRTVSCSAFLPKGDRKIE